MVVNTDFAIAFRSIYGNYDFNEVSLFNLEKISGLVDGLQIYIYDNKEIVLKTECPICGKNHEFKYSMVEAMSKSVIIGGCEEVGTPIFYLGKNSKVQQRIKKYNQINTEIIAMI